MRLDSDALIAVRRLRRHLTFWRLATLVGFALAIFVLVREEAALGSEAHVARLQIEGVIIADERRLDLLDSITEDDDAKALIVQISSPGGTFTGGESLFTALRRVAEKKPVVAVMGELATSGAFMAAIAADRIYAARGTVTGSIGVIMQSADLTGLMEKIGIKPETVKSGALKATPNPMEPLSGDARDQLQNVIDSLHYMFVEMVSERRGMSIDAVLARTGDGRIMTGREAVSLGLVDAIGDTSSARQWLAEARDIPDSLPLVEWSTDGPLDWWRDGARTLSGLIFGKSLLPERLTLDGIQALWHPSMSGSR